VEARGTGAWALFVAFNVWISALISIFWIVCLAIAIHDIRTKCKGDLR
jgi:hypothetical protein